MSQAIETRLLENVEQDQGSKILILAALIIDQGAIGRVTGDALVAHPAQQTPVLIKEISCVDSAADVPEPAIRAERGESAAGRLG